MKNLIITAAIILAPLTTMAQSFFSKYEDLNGVTSGVINQKMFSMIASMGIESDDAEAKALLDMAKKIESVKILSTGDRTISTNLSSDVEKYISATKLEELLRFKDRSEERRVGKECK